MKRIYIFGFLLIIIDLIKGIFVYGIDHFIPSDEIVKMEREMENKLDVLLEKDQTTQEKFLFQLKALTNDVYKKESSDSLKYLLSSSVSYLLRNTSFELKEPVVKYISEEISFFYSFGWFPVSIITEEDLEITNKHHKKVMLAGSFTNHPKEAKAGDTISNFYLYNSRDVDISSDGLRERFQLPPNTCKIESTITGGGKIYSYHYESTSCEPRGENCNTICNQTPSYSLGVYESKRKVFVMTLVPGAYQNLDLFEQVTDTLELH